MKSSKSKIIGQIAIVLTLCGCHVDTPFEKLKAQADAGDAEAAFQVAKGYAAGADGKDPDFAQAVNYYRKAAEKGNIKAENNLGSLYLEGLGVAKDPGEALKWIQKAAEGGSSLAQDNVGSMYLKGEGVKEDAASALMWYQKAAAQDFLNGEKHLGQLYYFGSEGVPPDYAKAREWLSKAAREGDPWSQNALGAIYESGQGVQIDQAQAFQWFLKAAKQGDAKAESNVSAYYLNGLGGAPKDPATAYMWLKLSDAQGEPSATNLLREADAVLTPADVIKGKKLLSDYQLSRAQNTGPAQTGS